MLQRFIEKPVLSTVISIILVILGVLGLTQLPLQQFPDIAPPSVLVKAVYPGANAETILRSVAPSLEEAINGVENMTYMSSTASNDGTLAITIYFKQGTNPDQAQVNVQNRVATAQSQLPSEVLQQGITTIKQQASLIAGIGVYSKDPKKYDQTFIANYVSINIIPEIKRIPGVASADIFGGVKDYSMRVWLNPSQMAAYHIAPNEVAAAIQDKNLEAAPGKFGERSQESFEYVIKYQGKFSRPEDYQNIPLRSNLDGSVLRLKDVARVELGAYSYTSVISAYGNNAIGFGIIQLAGSNSNEIQIALDELMEKAAKDFPEGMGYSNFYRTKTSLDESISQVQHTLVEAFILVFIVVFIFLQDFRSTLIPAIAVPVAILGTFFFLNVLGFSINLLTLFALVLAIGIVVDDAIVVVEAVHSKMEHENLEPLPATKSAMSEISGAIISITLVMSAVFLPVGFLKGSTGIFYRQFAFTMAIAILISAVNALTLSPALAALFLKNKHAGDTVQKPKTFREKFNAGFNRSFETLTNRYVGALRFLIARKWIAISALILITVASVLMIMNTKTGFIPTEDQGFIAISISTPSGTSLARTTEVVKQTEKILHDLPAGRFTFTVAGFNLLTNSSSPSAGVAFLLLKDNKERGDIKDINGIQDDIRKKLAGIADGSFFVFLFPTVPGFSNVEALDFVIRDKTGGRLDKFSDISKNFIAKLMKKPAVSFAFTTFRADYPQYQLEVDNDKANQLGVKTRDVLQTMQAYFGSSQASDFNRFGKYYRVIVQADIADKADQSSMDRVYVTNDKGESVPIKTLVKLRRVYGSETASRFNLFTSIQINAIPKTGYSSGDAIKAIEETAKEELPNGFDFQFEGQTREEISSGSQSAVIFVLSLVFVYFLLSAQYESYILPLAVMLSIPTGIFGVFVAIGLTGIENNIYVQVALIMLIGLLAKNAILIVEFAILRRNEGETLIDAALDGARSRLRPIIMTSLAFIAGMIPMMTAKGPSAQGNHSISIGAAGGMLSGVIFGVLIVPVLFVIFQHLQEKMRGKSVKSGAAALSLVLVLFAASSCKVSKDIKPANPELPKNYRTLATADTVKMAKLPYRSFFTDTTLVRLIDSAVLRNMDMQIALKNLEISRLIFRQSRLGNIPSLSASILASSSRPSDNSLNGLSLNQFLGSKHIEDYTASLNSSWEADIWGKISSRKEAALSSFLQSGEARKAVQTQVVADVSKAYYNLLMLDAKLEIARRNLRLNDSTLTIIRLQYDAGEVSSLAIQQADAQRLLAAKLIPQFEQEIVMQENALSVLSGRLPELIGRNKRLEEIPDTAKFSAGMPSELLSQRPDVRSAELDVDRANAEVGFSKARLYPSLLITAQGGVNAFKASDWFKLPSSLFGAVAGGITQPIFQRRELKTDFEVAKVQRDQSVIRFRQQILNAVAEVSDALVRLDKLDEQWSIAQQRAKTLQLATGNANMLFSNGMATYLEVITAQSNVLESELELVSIRKDKLDAAVELYRSLGGGWN